MKVLFLVATVGTMWVASAPAHQARGYGEIATTPPAAWADADPADSLYRAARRALNEKDYERAARLFDAIVSKYPRSEYTPDALYWKGFSLYRNGDLDDAVEALEAQAKRFPSAPTRGDASTLLVVIRGELAKRGDPDAQRAVNRAAGGSGRACDDMETQTAALDALQQMDADRVLPLLRKVLARRDSCSTPLRKNALFILAQKSGGDRERLLLEVAKSDPSLAVRQDAVFHLSQATSELAVDALEDLLLHSDERGVRSNALFALAQHRSERAHKILRDFALSAEAPSALRNDAIFHLAQRKSGGLEDLIAVYDRVPPATKKEILFHIAQRQEGAALDKLIQIAKTDPSPELRKDALFHIGQSKDPRALKALEEIVAP